LRFWSFLALQNRSSDLKDKVIPIFVGFLSGAFWDARGLEKYLVFNGGMDGSSAAKKG
jgi:hypothetical protein